MQFFAICGIIGFITGFPCALLVLFNEPRTAAKILWSLYSLSISLWGFSSFQLFTTNSQPVALFWGRMLNLLAILIPLFLFHFTLLLSNTFEQYKKTLTGYYLIYGLYLTSAVLYPEFFIPSVSPKLGFNFYPDAGPFFYTFPFLFFYVLTHGLIILFNEYRKATSNRRNQYKYFSLATVLAFLGCASSLLPVFNILIFPFGVAMLPIYNIMVAYVIVKHHLMDIRVIFRKGVIYMVLASAVTLLYLIGIYCIERFLHNTLGVQSSLGSVAVVGFIAIVFIPIKEYIQSFVDKFLFKASYLQVIEENDLLKQQVRRAERFQTMAGFSQKIISELKNPLTALIGYGHQLPNRLNDQEFLQRFIRVYDKEMQKIQELIQQLSDFSEIRPLKLESLCLTAVLNEVLEYLSTQFQKKEISVYKYFPDNEELLAYADQAELKRALHIIFSYSIKSTPNKGQVWIGIEELDDSLEISIKDTGSGLSQEELTQIFDPFFLVKKGIGDVIGSQNQSLAQAQNIISHHGGKILVDSQVNIGTEWIIQLPKVSKI